ncbi:hypothetical protein [Sphingorhabdus sp.]|uniref:hypothetical protein n=1 Tax=Sphingorhabdus sp. TaxID=1902408 RepID=UPI00391A79C7
MPEIVNSADRSRQVGSADEILNSPATPVEVIVALQPPPRPRRIDIVVSVREKTMETGARKLQAMFDKYRGEDLSEKDRHLIAGAFVTLADRLPMSGFDFVEWIDTCSDFYPDCVKAYAEERLGMQRIEAPVICNAAHNCGDL